MWGRGEWDGGGAVSEPCCGSKDPSARATQEPSTHSSQQKSYTYFISKTALKKDKEMK